jgi:orotate phosphoribosyltransferase-like protein
MDMKPTLLPRGEMEARKARELKRRGLNPAEIAEAMGLRKERVNELLRLPAERKPEARARA